MSGGLNPGAFAFVPGRGFGRLPPQQQPQQQPQYPAQPVEPLEQTTAPPPPPTISLNIGRPAANAPPPAPAPTISLNIGGAKPQTTPAPPPVATAPAKPAAATADPVASSAATKTTAFNFSAEKAKTDADAILQEQLTVADEDTLKDLYGEKEDIVDTNGLSIN